MFLETSAKTSYNVVEAFNMSAKCILKNIEKSGQDPNQNSNLKLKTPKGTKDEKKEDRDGCC